MFDCHKIGGCQNWYCESKLNHISTKQLGCNYYKRKISVQLFEAELCSKVEFQSSNFFVSLFVVVSCLFGFFDPQHATNANKVVNSDNSL